MRALLDTSVVIEGFAGDFDDVSVSVVTMAELHFGIEMARSDEERIQRMARAGLAHELFSPLPVDSSVAATWGALAGATSRRGQQPRRRAMDLLIAATAHVHGVPLLTHDRDLLALADLIDVRAPAG